MSFEAYVVEGMNTRAERLAEFLRRMEAAPPCGSEKEAMTLIADVLNAVENELSGITAKPDTLGDDGRMYPPMDDARRDVAGKPDLCRYRTRGHNTFVSADGAIRIDQIRGPCLLSKPAQSGRIIEL